MRVLDPLRDSLRELLGVPCFIRRCRREDALLVTDALRQVRDREKVLDRLRASGQWSFIIDGNKLLVDPSDRGWERILSAAPAITERRIEAYPADPFLAYCALRVSSEPTAVELQPIDLTRKMLKYLDEGDLARLRREFPPAAARLLRLRAPLPEAAGRYILAYILNMKEDHHNAAVLERTF